MKEIEDLMLPRFKVQISYPGSHFEVGQILECGDSRFGDVNYYKKFPSVFKELFWFEHRTHEELLSVLYVKRIGKYRTGEVMKVAAPDQDFRIWHRDNETEFRFIKDRDIIPATIQEYQSYISINSLK